MAMAMVWQYTIYLLTFTYSLMLAHFIDTAEKPIKKDYGTRMGHTEHGK